MHSACLPEVLAVRVAIYQASKKWELLQTVAKQLLAETSTRDYRVTVVFRRETDGWKLVHQQADSQMTKQPTN
jgi:ketosteroid isomerase-like protein